MTEEATNRPSDDSVIAEAEAEMMQLLNKEQCNEIALWLKLYSTTFTLNLADAAQYAKRQ